MDDYISYLASLDFKEENMKSNQKDQNKDKKDDSYYINRQSFSKNDHDKK